MALNGEHQHEALATYNVVSNPVKPTPSRKASGIVQESADICCELRDLLIAAAVEANDTTEQNKLLALSHGVESFGIRLLGLVQHLAAQERRRELC
jgi:hypothetical protein